MKTRLGFVSNSSSSSFVVALSVLTEKDIRKITSYNQYIETHPNKRGWDDYWDISRDHKKEVIVGYTSMDNGDLRKYLGENLSDKLTWKDLS